MPQSIALDCGMLSCDGEIAVEGYFCFIIFREKSFKIPRVVKFVELCQMVRIEK